MSFDLLIEDVTGSVIVKETLTLDTGKQVIQLGELLDQLNEELELRLLQAKVFGRRELTKLGRKYMTEFFSPTGQQLIERFGLLK